jgi:cytochrome d ubiquinol oxidase subunit I
VKIARIDKAHPDLQTFRTAVRFGAVTMLIAGAAVIWTGDEQAKLMFEQQPIKMAAAEALCETQQPAGFSILTIGNLSDGSCENTRDIIVIPGLLSYMATGDWNAEVTGLNELQVLYAERYGATTPDGEEIHYQPNLMVTYWSFRLMIGLAVFCAVLAIAALWLTRKGRVTDKLWFSRFAVLTLPMPYLAASFGWIFTEMGRQPFVVAPNPTGSDQVFLMTQFGVSSVVPAGVILSSLIIFTVVYAVLGVFWFRLIHRYAVEGLPDAKAPEIHDDSDRPLSFAY